MITRNNASQKRLKKKKTIIITLETHFPARPLKKMFFHDCH